MAALDISDQITEKVEALNQALLAQHPTMPGLLREIWQCLKANPEQVTLLEEEEIGVIVNGLKQQVKVEIATVALKTKTKSIKQLSLSDL